MLDSLSCTEVSGSPLETLLLMLPSGSVVDRSDSIALTGLRAKRSETDWESASDGDNEGSGEASSSEVGSLIPLRLK